MWGKRDKHQNNDYSERNYIVIALFLSTAVGAVQDITKWEFAKAFI